MAGRAPHPSDYMEANRTRVGSVGFLNINRIDNQTMGHTWYEVTGIHKGMIVMESARSYADIKKLASCCYANIMAQSDE